MVEIARAKHANLIKAKENYIGGPIPPIPTRTIPPIPRRTRGTRWTTLPRRGPSGTGAGPGTDRMLPS